jgi:hypothetical protein
LVRPTLIAVLLLLILAACSSARDQGVASLDDGSDGQTEAKPTDDPSFEDRVLAFAACMRDNGVEDFEDPEFNEDGSLVLGSEFRQSTADEETIQTAFDACREHIEGIAFGPGAIDLTEIQDRLLEFAQCMRDNGYDLPDPDFSGLLSGDAQGPFGDEEIDPDDPAFIKALDACQSIFEGFTIGG